MDARSLAEDLALDADGVGVAGPGTGRAFGGLLVGQALAAAQASVGPSRLAHSLHASFVRAGHRGRAVRYDVEATADGGSFSTRRVTATQADGVVLVLTAGFQGPEAGPEHSIAPSSAAPPPDGLGFGRYDSGWFESRDVPAGSGGREHARAAWFCARLPVGDDPALHQAALALMTDHGATRSIRQPHMATHDMSRRRSVSLDHAVWFHRPARVDRWLLYELVPMATSGGRGLAIGTVRTEEGGLVATVAQEALLRVPR